MAKKYYKLGAKASNFWDPSQSEDDNKKLTLGQVKALDTTNAVSGRVKSGGLVLVEKEEYDDYQKELKDQKTGAAKTEMSKSVKDANKKTKEAIEAKETAETSLKEAQDTNEVLVTESTAKDEELVELRAKVEALEAPSGEGGDNPQE